MIHYKPAPITPDTPLDDWPDKVRVADAAAWLGVGASTLYDAIRAGTFPAFRVGRKLYVAREAVRAHMLTGAAA